MRKVNYPSPHFDNLRLFSTPLNERLFLAGVFRKPRSNQAGHFSKASFIGFALPHTKMEAWDTEYRYIPKQDLARATFNTQNVALNQNNEVKFEDGPVSPL